MSKTFTRSRVLRIFMFAILLIAGGIYLLFTWTTPVTANIDSYIYDLPFKKGTVHRVAQGYGGLFSHSHLAAIDFDMPVGTGVFAAREGVMFSYQDNFEEGGMSTKYKNKANFIIIKHADGSFGCYWHLKKNGVIIKSGHVKKGQLIGLSGATGYVLRPHLHFSVKKILNYDMNSFVRTKFRTTDGELLLESWKAYTSRAN